MAQLSEQDYFNYLQQMQNSQYLQNNYGLAQSNVGYNPYYTTSTGGSTISNTGITISYQPYVYTGNDTPFTVVEKELVPHEFDWLRKRIEEICWKN